MIRIPLRPLARILSARAKGENPDVIEKENLRQRHAEIQGQSRQRSEGRLLVKYPLRVAINFFVADIGNLLPAVISGAEIVAVVMSLPTTGPILLSALQSQDMYLAGSFLMFLALLTVVGVLVSDIALAFLDPRIRITGDAP